MAATEWFRDWFSSSFYHKLYFERDEHEARNFISRLLGHLKPVPGSRLLDVACGRGRHSRFLAEAGYDVTGFDLSFESIREAQQYETDHLHFYQHDMRLPFWINYFHFAFNFFTSFGYFRTRREHDDTMRTIAGSLLPGGTAVFDYLNVHFAEDHLETYEQKEIGGTRFTIERKMDEDFFYKNIQIEDASLSKPVSFTEKVAKFNPGDFTDMLSSQKMQVIDIFGDYNLQPYDIKKSPRMIVVAKKGPAHPLPSGEKA